MLSACAILKVKEAPKDDIYDVIRVCVGKNITTNYYDRLLSTSLFLNELIDTLNMYR